MTDLELIERLRSHRDEADRDYRTEMAKGYSYTAAYYDGRRDAFVFAINLLLSERAL